MVIHVTTTVRRYSCSTHRLALEWFEYFHSSCTKISDLRSIWQTHTLPALSVPLFLPLAPKSATTGGSVRVNAQENGHFVLVTRSSLPLPHRNRGCQLSLYQRHYQALAAGLCPVLSRRVRRDRSKMVLWVVCWVNRRWPLLFISTSSTDLGTVPAITPRTRPPLLTASARARGQQKHDKGAEEVGEEVDA